MATIAQLQTAATAAQTAYSKALAAYNAGTPTQKIRGSALSNALQNAQSALSTANSALTTAKAAAAKPAVTPAQTAAQQQAAAVAAQQAAIKAAQSTPAAQAAAQQASQLAAQQKATADAAAAKQATVDAAAQQKATNLANGQAFIKNLSVADQAAIAKLPADQQQSIFQQLGDNYAAKGASGALSAYNTSMAQTIPGTGAYTQVQQAAAQKTSASSGLTDAYNALIKTPTQANMDAYNKALSSAQGLGIDTGAALQGVGGAQETINANIAAAQQRVEAEQKAAAYAASQAAAKAAAEKQAADYATQQQAAAAAAEKQAADYAAEQAAAKVAAEQKAADYAAQQQATQQAAATKSANLQTLNAAYADIQSAGSAGTVTQQQLDQYNQMAQNFGMTGLTDSDTTKYGNVIAAREKKSADQAAFRLPTGNEGTTTDQTVKDPMGNVYKYMPADPKTGQTGQWYKENPAGYEAVNSDLTTIADSPMVPGATFSKQLETTHNNIVSDTRAQAATKAMEAFNNSPQEKAFLAAHDAFAAQQKVVTDAQTKLTTLQNDVVSAQRAASQAQASGTGADVATAKADYQTALDAYNKQLAVVQPEVAKLAPLQKEVYNASNNLYTYQGGPVDYGESAAIQKQVFGVTNDDATAVKNAETAQYQNTVQADQAIKNFTNLSSGTGASDMSGLEYDIKSYAPGLLGDTSKFTTTQDYINAADAAYQKALTAYNNSSGDVFTKNKLAQDLQAAAQLNRAINLDSAHYNTNATENIQAANTATGAAAKTVVETKNAVSQEIVRQLAEQAAAARDAKNDWKGDVLGAIGFIAMVYGVGYLADAATAVDAAATASEMATAGATEAEIAQTLATDYGLDAAAADTMASATTEAVTSGVTESQLASAGFTTEEAAGLAEAAAAPTSEAAVGTLTETAGAIAPEAVATPVAEGVVTETALPGLAEGAVAPEAIASEAIAAPVAEGTVAETALPGLAETAPVAPEAVGATEATGAVAPEVAAETVAPEVIAPEVAPVVPEAGAVTTAPVAPEVAATVPENTIAVTMPDGTVGAYDPATGVTYGADGQIASTGYTAPEVGQGVQVASTEPTAGLAEATEPARVEVSGVAGTTEAPNAVTGSLTEGNALATPAQIDAGAATWNPAANAWEVPAAAAEMSPVIPSIIGTGAEAVGAVAPVIVGAGEGLTAAQIAGGVAGLGLGAAALGGGGGGAAAAAPVVTGGGAVAPVTTAPVTTAPVAPGTATGVPATTTPGTVVGAGGPGAVAPAVTPGTVPVTDVGTSAAGQTPLSPATTEVIPPGTSSVAPVEAQVVAPTDGLAPVTDATVTPAEGGGLPGSVGSGGLSATDLALLAAGWTLVNGILTPPVPPSQPGYGPIPPTEWGKVGTLTPTGMNPGYLMTPGVVQPQVPGATGTQTSYNWGVRPLIQKPSDIGQWNVAPTTPQFLGATGAAGTGSNRMNLNSLINETLGLGAARSAYPGAVPSPVTVPNYAATTSVNNLVNQTLGLGQQASGLAPVAPVAPRV